MDRRDIADEMVSVPLGTGQINLALESDRNCCCAAQKSKGMRKANGIVMKFEYAISFTEEAFICRGTPIFRRYMFCLTWL